MMKRPVKYSLSPPGGDRIYHINSDDVKVVLSRLPEEVYIRLRAIHLNDRAQGNSWPGYTTQRGRREIGLCALPPRFSFTRFLRKGQSPRQSGARRGTQWPELAIRRFLLYDVLLNEIGHLQEIIPDSKNPNRRFASEILAREFAKTWRRKLWSEYYDHPDPVHNAPGREELKALE